MIFEIYPHVFWRADPEEYNCSGHTEEEWAATGLKREGLGLYFVISGVFLMGFYIIVIMAMSHRSILQTACFKIMYFNCFVDLFSIAFNSVLTGVLFYQGAVFCTHPTIGYAPAAFGLAFWCSSCFNCLVIGINRCCTMFKRGEWLFSRQRPYIWIVMSCLYMVLVATCTRQASFNSALGAWFFFPFIDDLSIEAVKYKNLVHVGTNVVTAIGTTFLYATLCLKLLFTSRVPGQGHMSSYQYKIFVQCFLVCTLTGIAAYLYAYMQFFVVPVELIMMASFAWQFCSGLPCLVYIIVNQTIRRRVITLLQKGSMKSAVVTTFYNSKSNQSGGKNSKVHSTDTGLD